ncbi:nitrogen regulation protein NR(I) [Tepidimonas sp.]|uniref:nitrogen regulation protein NR(I) n=1 Tax=Tepidimonas sp. TaxID=2002775 RepID=UPI002FE3424F
MKPIWIADDDPSIRFVLEKALAREDLPTRSFDSPRAVLDALADGADDGPQVLVSDIRMPGGSGLELLEKVKRQYPALPVIIMTAYSDLDSAVAAFQAGAFEYLPKPFDLPKAVELIRRAAQESLREEAAADDVLGNAPEILGQAPAMQDVFRAIGRLSHSHVTVLITGESGTGKELVARALHKHSPRAKGPFIAINTAAIPKDLLESELFGHERGAFTGAQTLRRGRFEQAEGGTLFLDEIGDMPLELQTRLLRVLSDGHYYRVGGHTPLKAHVRIIAATHQNLEQRVREGAFREDLYHRLNVIRLRLPPLRERREDVPLLARFFLQQSARQLEVEPKRLSDEALAVLMAYDFPGNVRQLENLCHWLTVMAPTQVIPVKDLPPEVLAAGVRAAAGAAPAGATAPTAPTAPALSGAPDGLGVHPGGAAPAHGATASASVPAGTKVASPAGAEPVPGIGGTAAWDDVLLAEALAALSRGEPRVWDRMIERAERRLIEAALRATRGRRIEAAQRLGIGRNTITRKMQELGMDGPGE